MNFKTTIVLVILLLIAGGFVLFTKNRGNESTEKSVQSQQKVFADVEPASVTKLTITPASNAAGTKLAMVKNGANWEITEPVKSSAESFEVDALVRAITGLETTNIVTGATATGLDSPRYTIDLTASGKDYTLLVGDKTAVGDSLYVSLKGKPDTLVVSADLLSNLSKPVSTYRNPKLVDLQVSQIGNVTITRPDGSKMVLAKTGENWKVVEPTAMPAEKTDIDDILFGLTGLRATEWVAEDTKEASSYQLEPARYTATLTTTPTTLPTGVAAATTKPTTQPAAVVIKFGRYDDVMKKNVYVTTSQEPVIAKVGATVLEQLDKRPLDLRDKKVVDIDTPQVGSITIATDTAATTKPTTKSASQKTVTIKRRHDEVALGPTAPPTKPSTTASSTKPTTTVAKTQATTQPLTKWEVLEGSTNKPADDSKIDMLLSQLHPLRATKYLEKAPTTQPTATYTVTVVTQAAGGEAAKTHVIRLVDPGNSKPLIGTYNDLAFEVDRTIADRLSGDFLKGSSPSSSNEAAPPASPGTTFAP